jgi:hypothetical protein
LIDWIYVLSTRAFIPMKFMLPGYLELHRVSNKTTA